MQILLTTAVLEAGQDVEKARLFNGKFGAEFAP
jgi:hypothetical protein